MILSKLITGDGFGPMIARKGGGGGGSSSSGYSPAIQGNVEEAFGTASEALKGQLGNPNAIVADDSQVRQDIQTQRGLSQDALQGRGVFDDRAAVDRQLQNLQGQQLAQGQGSLGSARGDRARQAALADASLGFQQKRQQDAIAGAAGLQQAGQAQRGLDQQQLDSDHTARERYFGYLSNAPKQTTTSQSGGK